MTVYIASPINITSSNGVNSPTADLAVPVGSTVDLVVTPVLPTGTYLFVGQTEVTGATTPGYFTLQLFGPSNISEIDQYVANTSPVTATVSTVTIMLGAQPMRMQIGGAGGLAGATARKLSIVNGMAATLLSWVRLA